MIIDLILDRQDYESKHPGTTYSGFRAWADSPDGAATIKNARKMGMIIPEPYSPHEFYAALLKSGGKYAESITYAMDYWSESEVKHALCDYVIDNDYNPEICVYINSVDWLIPA